MTLELFQERTRAVGVLRLIRNSDNALLHLPTAKMTLDLGIEEASIEGMNPLGLMVTQGRYQTAMRPTLNLTFSNDRPEIMEMLFGRRFEMTSTEITVVKEYTVPANGLIPPVLTGQLGFGAVANDVRALASAMGENGLSRKLTRVSYATNLTAYNWGLDANMGLAFGTDLIGKTVSVAVPVDMDTALKLGEEQTGSYKFAAIMVTTENKTIALRAKNAVPSVAGNAYDPSSPEKSIKLSLDQPLGECLPFELVYTGLKVSC